MNTQAPIRPHINVASHLEALRMINIWNLDLIPDITKAKRAIMSEIMTLDLDSTPGIVILDYIVMPPIIRVKKHC